MVVNDIDRNSFYVILSLTMTKRLTGKRLTADTITDAQICELLANAGSLQIYALCKVALSEAALSVNTIGDARRRCALILNERAARPM